MQTIHGTIKFDGWIGSGTTNTINAHVHKFQLRRFGNLLGENTISMTGGANTNVFKFTTIFNVGLGSTNNLDGSYKGDMWLRRTLPMTFTGGEYWFGTDTTYGSLVTVKAGDSAEDNTVDIGDYGVFNSAYGSVPGDSNWTILADYNGDDSVDIGDYAIFNANYGLSGDN